MDRQFEANVKEGILADLSAGQAQPAAPPEPVAATPTPAAPAEPVAAQPAAAPAELPRVFKSKMKGDEVEVPVYVDGGQINPQIVEAVNKLRDYTTSKMALAEERRAFEAERVRLQQEFEVARAKQAAELAKVDMPDLPDDDPYAKRIKAIEARAEAIAKAQEAERQMLEHQRQAAARAQFDAEESRAAEAYSLDEREKMIVGSELYRRLNTGDAVASYDSVARDYHEWKTAMLAQEREKAVKEWKEKHRVGSDAAPAAVPAAAATSQTLPKIGSREFMDMVKADIDLRR